MGLLRLWILLVAVAWSGASAQSRGGLVVDGDIEDWGPYAASFLDRLHDVVPDTNSSIDLAGYDYGWGEFGSDDSDTPPRREAFAFLLWFFAPTFQGSDPTTVEVIFDASSDTTFGEAVPPWRNFLADYRVGATGSNGRITNRFHRRYVAGQWNTVEGGDIPQLKIELSDDGHWVEGEISWESIGSPGPVDGEGFPLRWTFLVSQGNYREYVPDDGWYEPWNPIVHHLTVVEPMSWGRIKDQSE